MESNRKRNGSQAVPKNNGGCDARQFRAYHYRDARGKCIFQVCRFPAKLFRQRRPTGSGGWAWNLHGITRMPYRLPELIAADPAETIYVTEGEKDTDRLVELGVVASTFAGGAGKWRPEYSRWFDRRQVVILPDNDQAGREGAQRIALGVAGAALSVKVVELPDLPEHGDVSDWLDLGGTAEALADLVEATPEWVAPPTPPTPKPPPRSPVGQSSGMHLSGDRIADRLAEVDLEALLTARMGPPRLNRWHCPNPSHADEHPSCTTYAGRDGRRRWKCHSCGEGGDVLDLIRTLDRLTTGEALKSLGIDPGWSGENVKLGKRQAKASHKGLDCNTDRKRPDGESGVADAPTRRFCPNSTWRAMMDRVKHGSGRVPTHCRQRDVCDTCWANWKDQQVWRTDRDFALHDGDIYTGLIDETQWNRTRQAMERAAKALGVKASYRRIAQPYGGLAIVSSVAMYVGQGPIPAEAALRFWSIAVGNCPRDEKRPIAKGGAWGKPEKTGRKPSGDGDSQQPEKRFVPVPGPFIPAGSITEAAMRKAGKMVGKTEEDMYHVDGNLFVGGFTTAEGKFDMAAILEFWALAAEFSRDGPLVGAKGSSDW